MVTSAGLHKVPLRGLPVWAVKYPMGASYWDIHGDFPGDLLEYFLGDFLSDIVMYFKGAS